MFKQVTQVCMASVLLAMSALGSVQASSVPENNDPIKIAMNEWTGQHISAKLAGKLLAKIGYNVEYITAGALPQFLAMSDGSLHVQPEVWTNNVGEIYPKTVASGDLVVLGGLGLEPREGWVYPPYMADKCPGLPDYKALYDCAEAFASVDTYPKGRLITYPADWGTRSKDLVASTELPFAPIAGGSEGAMIAELKGAYAAKEPALMMFWQPHWLFAEYELNWVEWSPANGECVEESQEKDSACGFQQAAVEKVISKSVVSDWPGAHRFLKAYTISNDMQNKLILEVDKNGRDLDAVLDEWIANNQSTWQPWVDAASN